MGGGPDATITLSAGDRMNFPKGRGASGLHPTLRKSAKDGGTRAKEGYAKDDGPRERGKYTREEDESPKFRGMLVGPKERTAADHCGRERVCS